MRGSSLPARQPSGPSLGSGVRKQANSVSLTSSGPWHGVATHAAAGEASVSSSSAATGNGAFTNQASSSHQSSAVQAAVALLPEKNYGSLRGGRYPFLYDPGYGLPVVREVVSYGAVLAAIREGRVTDILWFSQVGASGAPVSDGRCLVVYDSGSVAQAALLPQDARLLEAMRAWGVQGATLPPEPKDVPEIAQAALSAAYASAGGGLVGDLLSPPWLEGVEQPQGMEGWGHAGQGAEDEVVSSRLSAPRRGPSLGPSPLEALMGYAPQDTLEQAIDSELAHLEGVAGGLAPIPQDVWADYLATTRMASRSSGQQKASKSAQAEEAAPSKGLFAWMDTVKIDMETQAVILKYAPILGPVVGSSFIIGLYLLARLFKGDLTDRLKMVDQEKEKKQKQALREARVAFLEEEVPGMVARGAGLEAVKAKATALNVRLGPKMELMDSEVASTYEACKGLLGEGVDLSAAKTNAGSNLVAVMDAEERREAAGQAEGGGEGQKAGMDAFMEMGKLNTARIKKAVDPKIMDVKRRVRAARRKLKRESKVQLSDEVVFFDDVAGNEQAKTELREVVDFFRAPDKFKSSGARAPKGVLLVGPPGNGKTLMARAVAGEAGVAFISSSAAEFIELYMGLGAARVRDLFNTARSLSPCIIFIDELDAVGRSRQGAGKSNDERDNTVNQLLTEMDGFEAETQGIVVMGATNRKDVLDAALTRPGRFDRSIEVRRPDYAGRLEAIKVHLRDKPIGTDIDYRSLAAATGGMSGAQIAGVANTACFLASREGRTDVGQADLLMAVEQAKYGKASDAHRFVGPARRRRLAVMEAGISLASTLLPAMEPIEYVTIAPSSRSPMGRTVLKPNIGRYTTGVWTKRYLQEQLQVALAGRAAEEVVLGREEMSSLNQQRLMFARQIAVKMANAGMSDHPDYANLRGLGSQQYDPSSEPGRWQQYTITLDAHQTRSEWVDMDMEVEQRLNRGYEAVKSLLVRNRRALDAVTDLLLDKERVNGADIVRVVEATAHADDLAARQTEAGVALL